MKRQKYQEVNKVMPNPALFRNVKVGRGCFKPLVHKDTGTPLTDIEYLELLGRKTMEMDKANKDYPTIPTNYGEGIDRSVVAFSQEIVKGIDEGLSHEELQKYINSCLDVNA